MTDTDKSRELFNWLKREGECWHKWESCRESNSLNPTGWHTGFFCSVCGNETDQYHDEDFPPDPFRMDFFSPPSDKEWEWFGWLIERAREKDIKMLSDWRARIYWRDEYDLISCTALAEALYEWFSQKGQVIDVQA